MILLDTNVISELMRLAPDKNVVAWLDRQKNRGLWLSATTQAEIWMGLALMPEGRRKQSLQAVAQTMFSEDFANRCLAFDSESAAHYANIIAQRTRLGLPISVEDAQIAAIALANSLAIATRNVKDFSHIDGLAVLNPWLIN